MRKTRNRPTPPSPNGVLLLTVVFITLFLFTFAAVSLRSSYDDYRKAEKTMARQHAYYNACNLAEKKINELNRDISNQPEETDFDIEVNARQALHVSLKKGTDSYDVTAWVLVNTSLWTGDDEPLQLFVPEGEE